MNIKQDHYCVEVILSVPTTQMVSEIKSHLTHMPTKEIGILISRITDESILEEMVYFPNVVDFIPTIVQKLTNIHFLYTLQQNFPKFYDVIDDRLGQLDEFKDYY